MRLCNCEGFGYSTVTLPKTGRVEIGVELDGVDIEQLQTELTEFGYDGRVYLADGTAPDDDSANADNAQTEPAKRTTRKR